MSPPNLEILAYEDTPLGPLCLRRRELLSEPGTVVTEVTLNHEFLMSSYNTDSERAISNRSADIHGGCNLKALVGGFGLGYTARELLKDERIPKRWKSTRRRLRSGEHCAWQARTRWPPRFKCLAKRRSNVRIIFAMLMMPHPVQLG